ncbi:MAG: urea transporter [Rhodospirillales bacterium]|nr:urea transporter [Rhodospirillales bacterium]
MKHLFNFLIEVTRQVLTGFAQIMLQPSPLVGAAFLAGVFLNSPMLAMFGIVGCLSSALFALACKFPQEECFDGLYGFNGGLVGLGVGYYYDTSLPLLALVMLGGMVSSAVMYSMLRLSLRPFTFPFVLTAWVIMLFLSVTGWASPTAWSESDPSTIDLLESISRGYGQVLFQENVITGIIFITAITIRDWTQGLYATLATLVGLVCGYVAGFPVDAINLGLFGYNGVLCGILFAGRTGKDFISAITAILLSIAFVRLAHVAAIPALTFPFVLSSWLVLWGRRNIWIR